MSSSSPSSSYGIITELQPADVLFGRGSGPNDHEGNVWFRQMVAERKPEYMATNHRMTKAKIAREIVDAVLSKNGRFLRKLEAADAKQAGIPEGIDAWVCVDDDTIMEKAKQALRQNTTKTKTIGSPGGGAGSGGDLKQAPPCNSSGASIPSSSNSINSHHNNSNNNSFLNSNNININDQATTMARQIPASLSDDYYDDFEPLPITSSAVLSVNLSSYENLDNSINQQQPAETGGALTASMVDAGGVASLAAQQASGGRYYSVVSPQSTSLDASAGSQPSRTTAAGGLVSGGGGISTGATAGYGRRQQNQFLSHGPSPIVPWGSSGGGGGGDEDYSTLQQEPVLSSAPNVRQQQQQQQHHYQHQSQHQQQQNRYQQHPNNQSVARLPQQNDHQHQEQQQQQQHIPINPRESLTLKDVFRSSDGGNRRGSMDMSELMDSFRAAKLGPDETETTKRLMASTETMGTIEQYNTGSYAEMSMATMNSSNFSFMRGDDSMAQLDSSHVYDYQQQHHHRNSLTPSGNVGSSLTSNTLAGRSILVPGAGVGGRSNLSGSHAGSSNSTLHTTDSSSNHKFAQRDSVCSNKSTQSDTSISISDFVPRRRSAAAGIVASSFTGAISNLSGVREDAEGFGQEETQFSTADLDVDPLPMLEQQISSATVEGLSNSSLSMLKGMILSTDDLGALQDEQQQQQQQQQFSNTEDT